jgi:ketosteroid isomerase-like protein
MKRTTLVLATLAVAALVVPVAQAQDHPAAKADRARFDAMIAADTAALGKLLAPELSYVHSAGNLENKEEYIEAIRTGKYKYKSVTLEDVRVREYGDTAVIRGKATIDVVSGGQGVHSVIRFLDVWVKRDGAWQMIAWQSTRTSS